MPAYARTGEVDTVDGFASARRGRCATSASTSRCSRCTATTSTSACRSATPATRSHRRLPGRPPPLARAHRRPGDLDRGHMRVAEKWDGRMPNVGDARHLEGARAARRGRGRRGAGSGGLEPAAVRRAPEGDHREHRLAAHRAAAPAQRGAPAAAAPLGLVAQRAADVVARDDRLSVAIPARWRRRESRSASANALDSSSRRSTASCARARAGSWRATSSVQVQDAVGLQALEQRVAVPRLQDRGDRVGPGRVGVPDDAEAEERGHDRQPQAAVAPRRSPRPRSARRCAGRPRAPPASGRAGRRRARPARRGTGRRPRCVGWRCSAGIASASK